MTANAMLPARKYRDADRSTEFWRRMLASQSSMVKARQYMIFPMNRHSACSSYCLFCSLLIMLQPAMRKEHFPMERMTPRIMKPAIMATGIGTGASISWQNGGMREPGRSTGRERRRFAEYVGETVFLSATEKLRCSCRRLPQGTVTVSF